MFPVRPKYIYEDNGAETVLSSAPFFAPKVTVVARKDCAFKRIRLLNAQSSAVRAAKIKAKNEALSPNAEIVLVKDQTGLGAGVWVFDRQSGNGRHRPESLAVKPGYNEVRLLDCLTGFEGQIWVRSDLKASRWWAKRPSTSDWQSFILSADETEKLALPDEIAALKPDYTHPVPLFVFEREHLQRAFPASRVAAGIAGIAAVAMIFLAGQFLHLNQRKAELRGDISVLSEIVAENRALRGQAMGNLAFYERYAESQEQSVIFAVLETYQRVFVDDDIVLRSLSINGTDVEVRTLGEFSQSEPDFVRAVEQAGLLQNVRVTSRNNGLTIFNAELSASRDEPAGLSAVN